MSQRNKRRFIRNDYVVQTGHEKQEYHSATIPMSEDLNAKRQLLEGITPSSKLGVCSNCKAVVTLDFPEGYDFSEGMRVGEKVMTNKPVRAYCQGCRRNVEFVPASNPRQVHNMLGDRQDQLTQDFKEEASGVKPNPYPDIIIERQ